LKNKTTKWQEAPHNHLLLKLNVSGLNSLTQKTALGKMDYKGRPDNLLFTKNSPY
jgi:hypothetical protein